MQYSDEQKQMIQEIVDYIAKLPVGTVITTMGLWRKYSQIKRMKYGKAACTWELIYSMFILQF